MVPIPESVNISSRMACGSRPSSTCARGTPPRTAVRQASIFGTIPPSRPGSIGQQDQLRGTQRDRDRGGRGVGVHVVDVAGLAPGHARDDGDATVGDQGADRPGIDRVDLADLAEVHWRAVHGGLGAGRREQVGVLPGHPDRERPVPVDQADQVPVHLPGEDHPDHAHRLRRGHSQPRGERARDAQPAEVLADLRAAPVYHHRAQPGVPQEHHVLREREAQVLVGHGVAAELDHDGLAVELLQPGQRLDQGRRLGQRAPLVARGVGHVHRRHVEYAEFSCT